MEKEYLIQDSKPHPLVDYYTQKGVIKTEEISLSINRMGPDVAKDMVEYIKNYK